MKLMERASNAAYSLKITSIKYSRRLCYNVAIRPIGYVTSRLTSLLEGVFLRAKTTGEKFLLAVVIFLSLLWISVISYASFYNLYLPTAEISRPVHLSFSVCPEGVGICSFPSANVSLSESNPIKEILGSGQVYSVIIEFQIPETPVNRDLGMFMVIIKMFDRFHYVSASSKRSALFKYRSIPMRILSLTVLSPLFFFGFYDEKQHISVEMFPAYTDDFYHPSVGAFVEVQNHNIQIYSCQLSLYARFSGLRYILYYWPITSAICGISSNFTLCVLLLTFAFFNKQEMLRRVTLSLSQESLPSDDANKVAAKKGKKPVKGKDEIGCNQSTQTRTKEEDDLETYDLPLVQEPADFGGDIDDKDLELMVELRHRRVQ